MLTTDFCVLCANNTQFRNRSIIIIIKGTLLGISYKSYLGYSTEINSIDPEIWKKTHFKASSPKSKKKVWFILLQLINYCQKLNKSHSIIVSVCRLQWYRGLKGGTPMDTMNGKCQRYRERPSFLTSSLKLPSFQIIWLWASLNVLRYRCRWQLWRWPWYSNSSQDRQSAVDTT